MPRLKAIIEYQGTNFCGMQGQQNHNTIQGEIERALKIILKSPSPINFSGRTDAGVHAMGQVISFNVDDVFYNEQNKKLNPLLTMPRCENAILQGVNFFLAKNGIAMLHIEKTEDLFDPRKWAIERTYIYKILNRPAPCVLDENRKWHISFNLNIEAMQNAAAYFIGQHNFTSFRSKECTAPNPVRTINSITINRLTNAQDIEIVISARSFLHKMVRNIVGTLVYFGKNSQLNPQIIETIIASQNRSNAFTTAPAHGLYFYGVRY